MSIGAISHRVYLPALERIAPSERIAHTPLVLDANRPVYRETEVRADFLVLQPGASAALNYVSSYVPGGILNTSA